MLEWGGICRPGLGRAIIRSRPQDGRFCPELYSTMVHLLTVADVHGMSCLRGWLQEPVNTHTTRAGSLSGEIASMQAERTAYLCAWYLTPS